MTVLSCFGILFVKEEDEVTGPSKGKALMLRNIPRKMTDRDIRTMLESLGFSRSSAVIRLPGRNKTNMGYGFLWFHQADDAQRFKEIAVGYKFPDSNSTKRLDVTMARIQDAKPYKYSKSNVIGCFHEKAI